MHINTHTVTHRHKSSGGGGHSAAGSCCEKHPGGILKSTDPLRLRMCQYVNMCIWMHCSVFVFRDVLYSTMWPLMWRLRCWRLHGYTVAFCGLNLLKGCLTMQSSAWLWQSPVCLKKKRKEKNTIIIMCEMFTQCFLWSVACANCTWHQILKI